MTSVLSHLFVKRHLCFRHSVPTDDSHCAFQKMRISSQSQPLSGSRSTVKSKADRCSDKSTVPVATEGRQLCARRHILTLGVGILSCPCQQASPSYGSDAVVQSSHNASWHEELFARTMAYSMEDYEKQVAPLKKEVFSTLPQDGSSLQILELGMGTGPNLRYYARPGVHITSLDPNPAMRPYALSAAAEVDIHPCQLSFLDGVGQAIPLASESMDVVVGTLLLCSVPDVLAVLKGFTEDAMEIPLTPPQRSGGLAEAHRVLKKGGKYVFVEHVGAPEGTFLRWVQGALDPLQQLLADGCHLTRDPLSDILSTGFADVSWKWFEAEGQGLISPHLCGQAVKGM